MDTLPSEIILHHIWSCLPVTARRAWRIADPAIARITPLARDSRPWAKMLGAYRFGYEYRSYRFEIQCAYDDDLKHIESFFLDSGFRFRSDEFREILVVYCAEAAAMGGATKVFTFIRCLNAKYCYKRCVYLALENERFAFVKNACRIRFEHGTPSAVAFLDAMEPIDPAREATFLRRSPVRTWARRNKWKLVEPYVQFKLYARRVITHEIGNLLFIMAAGGNVVLIESIDKNFADFWTPAVVPYIVSNGTSAAGLAWFHANRPDFFSPKNKFIRKPRALAKWACRGGEPAVLAWLVDFGYFNFARDGKMLKDHATKKGYSRTLKWYKEAVAKI